MGSELQKEPLGPARLGDRTIYVRTSATCGLVGITFITSPDEVSCHCSLCGVSFTTLVPALGTEVESHAKMHAGEWEKNPHRFLIRLAHNPYWQGGSRGS